MRKNPQTVAQLVQRFEAHHSTSNRIVGEHPHDETGQRVKMSLNDIEGDPNGLLDGDHESDLDLLESPPCIDEVDDPIPLHLMPSFR